MNMALPDTQTSPAGALEGKVTISPVYPHDRIGVSNEATPEVYRAHRLAIFAQDGKTKIKEIPLDGSGKFKTDLPPGSYVIDVMPHDIGRPNLNRSQKITVQSGQTTTATFDLDTGMR